MFRMSFIVWAVLLLGSIANAAAPWGLVGNWTFNDGTANDSSSVGANGTLQNSAVIVNDPAGNPSRGKVLDTRSGVYGNGKMTASDNINWEFNDYATINAWVLVPTSANASKCSWSVPVVCKGGRGTPRIFYSIGAGSNLYFFDWSTWNIAGDLNTNSNAPFPPSMTWHMITSTIHLSVDSNGLPIKLESLYLDGVFKVEKKISINDTFVMTGDPFTVGAFYSTWSGYVDDVGYWHGWLTPETITGLYNGTYTNLTAPYSVDYPDANNLGNMDNNGQINLHDLELFSWKWLDVNCVYDTWCGGADSTHSGTVNFDDFAILANNWLQECPSLCSIVQAKIHSAVTPIAQTAGWWTTRHQSILTRVGQGNVDMIFVGDSITQSWENTGLAIWNTYYAPRNAVNMGFSGDKTQNVLWRLDNGEINGISPKVAVVMIGTNNTTANITDEIADGIIAVCCRIQSKLPNTKILLLAIFPRADVSIFLVQKNAEASLRASRIADGQMIHYMDIGNSFKDANGNLIPSLYTSDMLHLSYLGYQTWATEIEAKIVELMGE